MSWKFIIFVVVYDLAVIILNRIVSLPLLIKWAQKHPDRFKVHGCPKEVLLYRDIRDFMFNLAKILTLAAVIVVVLMIFKR